MTHSDDPPMILMVTAAGDPAARVTGLALGADDYLPKPFHFPELVLRIRALARANPPPAAEHCTQPGSNSTSPAAPSPASDGRSNSAQKSVPCSKPCSKPAPAHSAQSSFSRKLGTRTSTH
jgi:DNA-binding response OmpR family regulator